MGRTERRGLVAGSIVFLLALSAVTAVAAPVASGGPLEPSSTLSGSPRCSLSVSRPPAVDVAPGPCTTHSS